MRTRPTQGFTLIELLLYVSISATLLLAVSIFLSVLLEARVKNQTVTEVEQQGLQVMHHITQALRNAHSINSPATSTSATGLSLRTDTASTTPVVFDLTSGTVRITEGTGVPTPLTNSRVTVSGLTFSNVSLPTTPGIVGIRFTVSSVNTTGRREYAHTQEFIGSAALRQP